MAYTRIAFPEMAWTQGAHPLERKKEHPSCPVTLLEFGPGFEDPHWCPRGHAGLVLSGELRMVFRDGSTVFREGDAFFIEPETAHRAENPGPRAVTLFLFSTPHR